MTDPVRQIADAVLYEGHVLWPYRRSSVKNRQRWTFGGVYPAAYARTTGDRSAVLAQCLVEGDEPSIDVEVRFLQIVRRQLYADGTPVEELELAGTRHLSWDEAAERAVTTGRFELPAGRSEDEPYVRTWERLEGHVDLRLERLRADVHRLTLTIENASPWSGATRDEAMRRTLASAHGILHVRDGEFVSAVDPPEWLSADAEACRSEGLWPFLVGAEGDRTTLLASPIILYDYPQVAPESPGDFFDGCEIDQLLVLSILGLSDDEKREVRAGDPRAREILARTEAMSPDELARLHGVIRDLRSAEGK
jgi:hypothetical protein